MSLFLAISIFRRRRFGKHWISLFTLAAVGSAVAAAAAAESEPLGELRLQSGQRGGEGVIGGGGA